MELIIGYCDIRMVGAEDSHRHESFKEKKYQGSKIMPIIPQLCVILNIILTIDPW